MRGQQKPIGQAWLRNELRLPVPEPAVESYVVAGSRRTESWGDHTREYYPSHYAINDSVVSHLRFALRHEAFDLRLLISALKTIDPVVLEKWQRGEPTGAYSRRIWYLYETFTGRTLDLINVKAGNYVGLLDSRKHFVSSHKRSRRHRIVDNLLGGPGLCPIVRRTRRLDKQIDARLDIKCRLLLRGYDPSILTRAVNYLYTKETRSSFAIEGETASASRAKKFVAALSRAAEFPATSKDALVALQGSIVDPRYVAGDWRDIQVFVGQTVAGFREHVHYIAPRPEDVPTLMDAWNLLTERTLKSSLHPVLAAAIVAFSFVFIHPFDDGNGRIHRFLIHHVLAARGFTPRAAIFPVSAAILRNQHEYDTVLESFSGPLANFVKWKWTRRREVLVENETVDLYRYFDATRFAEFLFDRINDTLHVDLQDELEFITLFDKALKSIRSVVDMPDRRASLFVRLCMQNGGKISRRKRKLFGELTDSEISQMERKILSIIGKEQIAELRASGL